MIVVRRLGTTSRQGVESPAARRCLFVIACVSNFLGRATGAKERPPQAVQEVYPAFEGARLVPLEGGRLLLWNRQRTVRLRESAHQWTELPALPFDFVWQVVADEAGFLALGSPGPGKNAVTRMARDGRELERWNVDGGAVDLFSVGGQRWVGTDDGLRALLPGGKLGEQKAYLDRSRGHTRVLIPYAYDQIHVLCQTSDRTKAGDAVGRCRKEGDEPWTFRMDATTFPVACGPWLVTPPEKTATDLVAHSFATGEALGRRRAPPPPRGGEVALACTERKTLLVGGRDLQEVALPSMKVLRHMTKKAAPIAEIASLGTTVAFRREGSSDITFIELR